jgi:hypothetical protein
MTAEDDFHNLPAMIRMNKYVCVCVCVCVCVGECV